MSYLQHSVETDPARWRALQPWLKTLLSAASELPTSALPIDEAKREGVLPWLAYALHDAKLLEPLGDQRAEIRNVLHNSAALHMFGERELSRVATLAAEYDIDFVAFKGHAVARSLYAHPACRPTSDFDVLVSPAQVETAQDWLNAAGYRPHDPYFGNFWLAGQAWVPESGGPVGGSLDLHWDVSNRMYYRHRVSIENLIREAERVPCGESELRVPGLHDNCIIACIHLAAMDPGVQVDMRWLLDIRLLMAQLAEGDIEAFIERAGEWRAIEACLVFGEAAAQLDDSEAVAPVLEALRGAASEKRMKEYDRTLESRGYDLWAYWRRLPAKEKAAFFGDLFRKISSG